MLASGEGSPTPTPKLHQVTKVTDQRNAAQLDGSADSDSGDEKVASKVKLATHSQHLTSPNLVLCFQSKKSKKSTIEDEITEGDVILDLIAEEEQELEIQELELQELAKTQDDTDPDFDIGSKLTGRDRDCARNRAASSSKSPR